ncbi:putative 2OG-Fe(II) oxygenase [Stenotrophomonas sp. MMGLT7]|uniref:putative 2OG-Fe(II) oxygenase n=1 Tax=Stenotrophomonas sp. MMGLT7 TaxID=2901227 RepID=UPI001E4E252D|nr:putative 2OG-Fe(II) oxygenase [Stenotrophomonas sp. MMGLT7]MCD7100067.1 2OG-Fe(II) oxygenase family protein [Stenotrophomonas sp. MMGLT7]
MNGQSDTHAVIHPLYAVPLLQSQFPDSERMNADLARLFLQWEAQGDIHRDSTLRDTQHGIFESDFYLHRRKETPVRMLFDFIHQTLLSFIQGINQYPPEQMSNLDFDMHSWFHVTRKGGFQCAHNHPNASWSAIYCVTPGEPVSPLGGSVRFHDPRTGSDMYRDPANDHMQIPYRLGSWQLNHKAGQLIGFPSYLLHEVLAYDGEQPRITVALNAWTRWKR